MFLMVCTIRSAKGGGDEVLMCLILEKFDHLTNSLLIHAPSISWYIYLGIPILFNTYCIAPTLSDGVLLRIGTA
jgi:hypothetical protein